MGWLSKVFGKNTATEEIEENVVASEPVVEESNKSDDELIAVLTAAIAALQSSSQSKLVIRSYRRVNEPIPIWNRVARENLIN